MIYDSGSELGAVNLFIPKYIVQATRPFLDFSASFINSKSQFSDMIINIMIFIPLGIFIHGMLSIRYGGALMIALAALLAGTLFTLGVESLQHLSLTRNSSLTDVFMNMAGTALGIAIHKVYDLFLNYRAERFRASVRLNRLKNGD